MRNAWIICRKELGSYFVSPVAYLLLTMFGLIFGFFFWNALGYFVIEGMEMQMRGQIIPHEPERADHPAAAVERGRDRTVLHSR